MKYISRLLGLIMTIVNILMVIGLWVCAYSSYFSPVAHPIWACAGLAFPVFLILNILFIVWWLVVYRYYVWISLLGLLVAYPALRTYVPIHPFLDDESLPTDMMKVLSYNCESFAGDTPHTADAPNPVLEYLSNCGADIICLQEATFGRRITEKVVNRALSDYPYHHVQHIQGTGLAIYSRYPIVSAHKVNYASQGNGSMVYRVKTPWDTLTVVNNHLESNKLSTQDREVYREMMNDPEKDKVKSGSKLLLGKLADAVAIRAPQADSVAAQIRRSPDPMIIACGDFNDSPLSYAHRVIGQGLTDAFTEAGNGLGISYHENRFYFRIDHILMSKALEPYKCVVDRTIAASDHYPIWCLLAPSARDYVKY
jgi:endonuclease/exonuclease/phosphatase family metal-dependent hydrolase